MKLWMTVTAILLAIFWAGPVLAAPLGDTSREEASQRAVVERDRDVVQARLERTGIEEEVASKIVQDLEDEEIAEVREHPRMLSEGQWSLQPPPGPPRRPGPPGPPGRPGRPGPPGPRPGPPPGPRYHGPYWGDPYYYWWGVGAVFICVGVGIILFAY